MTFIGGIMKSINALRRGSFLDKTEVVIYILALFTFVLLILTFTRDKKKHLFQDQDLIKVHLLKSQYSEGHKSNLEFIGDLSHAVSVNNKSLIPTQPVIYGDRKSVNENTHEDNGLVEKPSAPKEEKAVYPDNEESLSLKGSKDSIILGSTSTDRAITQSTEQSKNKEPKKNTVIEANIKKTLKSQPENKMLSKSNELNEELKQEKPIDSYRVKRGDCMSFIANKFNVSLKRLLRKNPMKNPNIIYIGSIINIPKSK